MEIDKTQLTEDVAAAIWNAEDSYGLNGPWEEAPKMVKFNIKTMVLPVLVHSLPIIEDHVVRAHNETVLDIINKGYENKNTPEEILLNISLALM